jgi:CRP-like cAMP-binding protein
VGSILAPALIALAGQRGAFVAAGAMVMVGAGLLWRPLRRGDDVGIARPRELALLRGQPIFAPLGPAQLEHLAAHLVPVQVHAGDAIIRQGDPGHHFFIVVHGRVGVEVDGRAVREEGPGESFGEIALLRSVPRTATVRAVEDAELVSLERRAFLEAITGQPASEAAAEAVVRERLGAVPDAVREEADANA